MNALATSMTFTPRTPPGLPWVSQESLGPVVLLVDQGIAPAHVRHWALTMATALNSQLVEVDLAAVARSFRSPWLLRRDRVGRLAATLKPLGARVVVMPGVGWPAEIAGRLATETNVPCLVARAPQEHRGVLAATSLDDVRHPVLREAAVFARALGRPLTVLHNAAMRIAGAELVLDAEVEQRLQRVATELGAAAVVTHSLDAVSGILTEARGEDADLIVVGASASHSTDGPVGAQITGLARRSVLVVPIAT